MVMINSYNGIISQNSTLSNFSFFEDNLRPIYQNSKISFFEDNLKPIYQNPKISFFEDNLEPIYQNSKISFFEKIKTEDNWAIVEKQNFALLLMNRKKYLDSLSSLNNNWINGKSEIPSQISLSVGKRFLSDLTRLILNKRNLPIPKIIIGPIPSGGICFELHINENNAMYVSIFNEGTIDIDLKYYDYYYSITESMDANKIIYQYRLINELPTE